MTEAEVTAAMLSEWEASSLERCTFMRHRPRRLPSNKLGMPWTGLTWLHRAIVAEARVKELEASNLELAVRLRAALDRSTPVEVVLGPAYKDGVEKPPTKDVDTYGSAG